LGQPGTPSREFDADADPLAKRRGAHARDETPTGYNEVGYYSSCLKEGAMRRRAVRLEVLVVQAGLWLPGCGAMREASFATTDSSCSANSTECEEKCKAGPSDSDECNVVAVRMAEDAVAKRNPHPLTADALDGLHTIVARLCKEGISRACKADEGLLPMLAEAQADERSRAKVASEATTSQSARIARIKQEAKDVLKALGRDESSCSPNNVRDFCNSPGGSAAGSALALANADVCGPDLSGQAAQSCSYKLDEAEKKLAFAHAEVARIGAEKEQAARARQQIEATNNALTAANDRCKADAALCQQMCATDAASYECVGLGNLFIAGDPRVTKSGPNPGKARELGAKACAAANNAACAFVSFIDDNAKKCSGESLCQPYCATGFGASCTNLGRMYRDGDGVTQDQAKAAQFFRQACNAKPADDEGCKYGRAASNLSSLFAQCSANRSEIERWRIAGVQAAHAGNGAAAQRAAEKIRDVEPKWNQTLSDLREAISRLTGDQGPRFQQLIVQVKAQCSCEPTRSGACR